jgi:Uma2 family endonuclease
MPLPEPLPVEEPATARDYWNLPDGVRAELYNGKLHSMAPPSRTHQRLVHQIATEMELYIRSNGGSCQVYPAPFAVNLTGDDRTWFEPDISVVCDPSKLSERGCEGAPDLVVEVVSPSSTRTDYLTKAFAYDNAGVREYWIVDPGEARTVVYRYKTSAVTLRTFAFSESVSVGIFDRLSITIADLL